MYFDIVIVFLAVILIWLSARRGILLSLYSFFGNLIAAVLAFFLVAPVTGWLQKAGILRGKTDSIAQNVDSVIGKSVAGISDKLHGFLPESWANDITKDAGKAGAHNSQIALNIADLVVMALVFLVLFIILRFAMHFIVRKIHEITHKIPVLGTVDTVGGAIFGVLSAVLLIIVITTILSSLAVTDQNVGNLIKDSKICGFIANVGANRGIFNQIFK